LHYLGKNHIQRPIQNKSPENRRRCTTQLAEKPLKKTKNTIRPLNSVLLQTKSSPSPDTTEDETEAADGEAHTYPSDQEKLQQTNALI
jgi:hypothetical protein